MATTDQQQQPTAKERYRSRYGQAHPDLNLDDEEAFYAQANDNLDELEGYRESNRVLGEAMDKSPILAGIVLAAKSGQNPFAYLAENIGPDMDIRTLAENPEFAEQMGKALKTFQEAQDARQVRDKEIGDNIVKSIATLKEIQNERGLPDDEVVKLTKDFFGEFDEDGNPVGKDSFMALASNGIVTKGMWEALINARHYDGDIAAATEKATASALNQKVQNGLKDFGGGEVPNLSRGGAGRARKPANKGGFADWGKEELEA